MNRTPGSNHHSSSVHWSIFAIVCLATLYLLSAYVDTLRYSIERGAAFREAQRTMVLMAAERSIPVSQMAAMQGSFDLQDRDVIASR